mgnify:CR=1 FL=1
MSIEVRLPTLLRPYAGNQSTVEVAGQTLREAVDDLVQRHPDVAGRILEESGELRKFVNVYVNDDDVRFTGGLSTAVKDGDSISILPAVAGG